MNLSSLLTELEAAHVRGSTNREITGIAFHSKTVQPGMLFVAIRGLTHDGHAFTGEAVERGAAAVVAESPVEVPPQVTLVHVPESRLALARISCAFYRHPSRQTTLIGVTGTNGKGTTAYLAEAVLSAAGERAGVIGTMGAKLGLQTVGLDRTTPEAPELQQLLRQMVDAGLRHVLMEVASHGLVLRRVDGCRFSAAVFTNLTQDHLDFHKTFEAYRAAKRRLFEMVSPDGAAVINADDPSGSFMAAASRAPVVTYGLAPAAHVRGEDVRLSPGGTDFTVRTRQGSSPVHLQLRGRFNVYNALAAIALTQALGIPLPGIAAALAEFPGVPGRFESVDEGQPFGVIVDYAHTPDGLENVLQTAREFVRGRTIVVFGAGGDRDRMKRPVMGQIALRLADIAIVTSDNPRNEEPMAIIEEIMAGIRDRGPGTGDQGAADRGSSNHQSRVTSHGEAPGPRPEALVEVEPDRRKAIYRAIELAQPGDMVIIAGKGHEPYQEIKGVKYPFDDRVVAREALRQLKGLGPRA